MTRALFFALPAAALLLIAAAPDPAAPAPQKPTASNDPNQQVICEKQEVLGSRLATRRVCKTRAQWADDRLQDRQEIEKVQMQRGMPGK